MRRKGGRDTSEKGNIGGKIKAKGIVRNNKWHFAKRGKYHFRRGGGSNLVYEALYRPMPRIGGNLLVGRYLHRPSSGSEGQASRPNADWIHRERPRLTRTSSGLPCAAEGR
jgi:hypothetical protein